MLRFPAFLLIGLLMVVLALPATALAQTNTGDGANIDFRRTSAGLYFGYDFEVGDPLVGVDARFTYNLAPNIAASLNPGVSYYFMSERRVFGFTIESQLIQFDINALGHLIIDGPLHPYLGAGLAISHARVRAEGWGTDTTETETNLGLNLVIGTEISIDGPLTPFLQFRATFLEQEEIDHANFVTIMGGLSYEF